MRTTGHLLVASVLLTALPLGSTARAVTLHFLNFEGLADFTTVTNQYAAQFVSFTNTTVLTAGISLNDFEYPPQSGTNVASNLSSGAIQIDFSRDTYDWSAYVTYERPLTVSAFDQDGNFVASLTGGFPENYTSSGYQPNEFLSLSAAIGFRQLVIQTDFPGYGITVDDMSYTTADASPVPEPATAAMLAVGLLGTGLYRRVKRRAEA